MTTKILIVEDDADSAEFLRLLLEPEGYVVQIASTAQQTREEVASSGPDIILMDLMLPDVEGLDLLSQIRRLDPTLPVVVMTAWSTVELAVEAMRRGASDFIQKPWENARLVAVLRTQVELGRAHRRTRQLEAENALLRPQHPPAFIARAPAMQPVLQVLARVGPSDANVLIKLIFKDPSTTVPQTRTFPVPERLPRLFEILNRPASKRVETAVATREALIGYLAEKKVIG